MQPIEINGQGKSRGKPKFTSKISGKMVRACLHAGMSVIALTYFLNYTRSSRE